MTRYVLALALALALGLAAPACTPRPATIVTPAGQLAFTADQIVLRVNELQAAAVDANRNGILDIGTTRTIVNWSINADTVLKVLPAGWKTTLIASWHVAKAEIHTTNSIIQSAMAAVDAVLGGV